MEAVSAAHGPAGDDRDDHFRHEPDETLHLEDVEAARSRSPVRVLVAVLAADALIAPRAERPAAILRGRPVAGEQDATDVRRLARVVEGGRELVHGLRAERVPYLGSRRSPCAPSRARATGGRSRPGSRSRPQVPARGIEDRGHHGAFLRRRLYPALASRRWQAPGTPGRSEPRGQSLRQTAPARDRERWSGAYDARGCARGRGGSQGAARHPRRDRGGRRRLHGARPLVRAQHAPPRAGGDRDRSDGDGALGARRARALHRDLAAARDGEGCDVVVGAAAAARERAVLPRDGRVLPLPLALEGRGRRPPALRADRRRHAGERAHARAHRASRSGCCSCSRRAPSPPRCARGRRSSTIRRKAAP